MPLSSKTSNHYLLGSKSRALSSSHYNLVGKTDTSPERASRTQRTSILVWGIKVDNSTAGTPTPRRGDWVILPGEKYWTNGRRVKKPRCSGGLWQGSDAQPVRQHSLQTLQLPAGQSNICLWTHKEGPGGPGPGKYQRLGLWKYIF